MNIDMLITFKLLKGPKVKAWRVALILQLPAAEHQNPQKCMGEGLQKMVLEHFNLHEAVLHQKP